jgi:hypothetical protein
MMVNSTTNDEYDVDRGNEENDYDLIIMMATETPMMDEKTATVMANSSTTATSSSSQRTCVSSNSLGGFFSNLSPSHS